MKIGMLFPDYGNQFVGMGKELYDNSRIMQEYFEEASNCLNINFVKLCFASSENELAKITHAYAALFLTSVSIAALLQEQGINPDIVAGYGIGELSATHAAGGLSFPDGLYFLNKYANFYQEELPHLELRSLKIKGLAHLKAKKFCAEFNEDLYVSTIETDDECIVTGNAEIIPQLEEIIRKEGVSLQEVSIESGLRSSLMENVVNQLSVYLHKIDFKNLNIPLLATADAKEVTKGELVKNRIIKQLSMPLAWHKIMKQCADWDVIIEVGPGTNLATLLKNIYPDKPIFSVNKQSDIELLQNELAKLQPAESEQPTQTNETEEKLSNENE